jgi:tetratricopeptide (TPR) repeat protein
VPRPPRLAAAFLLSASSLLAGSPKTDEGVRLLDAGRRSEARAALEAAAREDPKDARAAVYLGRIFLAQEDLDNAVLWLEKAVALDAASSENQLWLGRAYGSQAIKSNVFKQASLAGKVKRAFEKSVELDANNLDARFAVIDYYLQAPGIMGGSVEKAREQAAEIARRDALRGYRAVGRIAEYEKNFDAALAVYARAEKEFPGKREPFFWMTNLYSKQKEYGKAFDVMEKLLTQQPAELLACFQIGNLAAQSGERLDRGEECLKLYLAREPKKTEPSLAATHLVLGRVYEKKGSRDLARREYEAALKIDPSLKDAQEALKNLVS